MSTLYDLTGQRLALAQKLEAMNFDEETIADTLEGESMQLEAKIQDYGFVIKNRHSFADQLKVEIARLQEKLEAEEKRVKKIEDWLIENMKRCDITEVSCPVFTVKLKENPQSVQVDDELSIPPDYWRTAEPKPPVSAPDKRLILADLKAGKEIKGCSLKRTLKLEIK